MLVEIIDFLFINSVPFYQATRDAGMGYLFDPNHITDFIKSSAEAHPR